MTQHDGTTYQYNGDGVLVSDGTTTYTQDLAAPLSQILADGSATYVYGAGSERLRSLDGPWFLGDALGSVRTTLDDAGAVLATASYDPWGTPQGDLVAPFGFTGELHHGDQVYLPARWYTPGSGTFTTRDPFAGFPEMPYSLHAYQYAYSAPTVWTDPSGENPLVCLVPAVADGPMPVGDAVSVVCLVGYGLYAGAVALAGALTIDTAVTTLPNIMTPPLDPGPPESPVLRGAPQYVPARDDHLVSSPLTGPEEACWVIPGPLLMPPPWPFTTGAPGEPVAGPVVLASTYLQHDGRVGARFDPRNAHHPVKLGYDEYLRQATPPGISWRDDNPSWLEAGLVSFETASQGFWPTFHEIIKHTTTINFVVDGMDVFGNPQSLQGNQITHQEMDTIIRQGYVGKLHLWQNGQELTGQKRLLWIDQWKQIRGLP